MQQIDKDSFAILLWKLSPVDAIALRGTCRIMNERITNAQNYWFYKLREIDSNSRSTKVKAHVVPYNGICVGTFGYEKSINLLCEEYPEIDAEYHRRLATLGPQPPGNPWHDDDAGRYYREQRYLNTCICKEYFAQLIALPGFACNKSSHIGYVSSANSNSTTQEFQHEEMDSARDGLYMYHYLFACYQREKRRILTLAKLKPEIRADRVRSLRLQIEQRKQAIQEAEHELMLLTECERKYEAAKNCPFMRQKPETYQYKKKK